MKFKTKSPIKEITPQEVGNIITDNILILLKDEIYEMVEDQVCDKLDYEYDIDMDSIDTNDLNDFICDVYNVVYDNIIENL